MIEPTQQQVIAALSAYDDTIGFDTPTFTLRLDAIKAALTAASTQEEPPMKIIGKLIHISEWLRSQSPQLSAGLRSGADAEKLFDYWKINQPHFNYADGAMPFAVAARIAALGYDPMAEVTP